MQLARLRYWVAESLPQPAMKTVLTSAMLKRLA